MFKSLIRDRLLLVLVTLAILLRLFSLDADRVEKYYTYGIYPPISRFLRLLFGWFPFSIGDIFYAAAFIWLVAKVWKWLKLLASRTVKEYLSWILFRRYLKIILAIYVLFNLLWGLNYDRRGIASQLQLDVQRYSTSELYDLTARLQEQLCKYGDRVDSNRRKKLDKAKPLFSEAVKAYDVVKKEHVFLSYKQPSLKRSLLTPFGHWFGFTGYYNPFTAEAQLKSTIPFFLKPFVTCHEISHQLGYAKENEANFVAFLTARSSADPEFVYSAYFEIYLYAMRDLRKRDSSLSYLLFTTTHPQVIADYKQYREYLTEGKNSIEPIMTSVYESYLKMNRQPKGMYTYNEVVAWLIAYGKKYGREKI